MILDFKAIPSRLCYNKAMSISGRTTTGIVIALIGLILIVVAAFSEPWASFYGIGILVIGIAIIFNKKEDVIEKISNKKSKK